MTNAFGRTAVRVSSQQSVGCNNGNVETGCTVGSELGDLLSYTNYTHLQQNFSQHNPGCTECGVQEADIHPYAIQRHCRDVCTRHSASYCLQTQMSKTVISLSLPCGNCIPVS